MHATLLHICRKVTLLFMLEDFSQIESSYYTTLCMRIVGIQLKHDVFPSDLYDVFPALIHAFSCYTGCKTNDVCMG